MTTKKMINAVRFFYQESKQLKQLSKMIIMCLVIGGIGAQAASPVLINGAGATFPYPLYSKWFLKYHEIDKEVEFNYQSIGSGGGIRQLINGTIDFGASDAPMNQEEIGQAKSPVFHIPATLGAVAVSYSLPEVDKPLNLSPQVLVKIFLGEISKWDDEEIKKLNPKVKFPQNKHIVVCYRSDGSGTTSVFTDYLVKVSPQWKEKIGTGKSVKWPVGIGAKGNEGVSSLIKQNPGSIGYLEMTYAFENKYTVFALKNAVGEFVPPSVKAVTLAAEASLSSIPSDYRVSITDAKGKGVYPISAFTYLLVHQQMEGVKGKKIVDFLKWAMKDWQKLAPDLHYAPLPQSLVKKVTATIDTIKVN